jgi:hypothetical protein
MGWLWSVHYYMPPEKEKNDNSQTSCELFSLLGQKAELYQLSNKDGTLKVLMTFFYIHYFHYFFHFRGRCVI